MDLWLESPRDTLVLELVACNDSSEQQALACVVTSDNLGFSVLLGPAEPNTGLCLLGNGGPANEPSLTINLQDSIGYNRLYSRFHRGSKLSAL